VRDGAGSAQGVEVGFEVAKAEGGAGCPGHGFEDKEHYRSWNKGKAVCEETSDGAEVEAHEFVLIAGEWVRGTEEDEAVEEAGVAGGYP